MAILQEEISQADISQASGLIGELMNSSLKNPQFVDALMLFLEGSVSISNFPSPYSKLSLINFIDKMNRSREQLEIESGNLNIDELRKAANRFGLKAQSGFKTGLE